MPSRRKAKKLMHRRDMPIDYVDFAKLVTIGFQLFHILKSAGQEQQPDPDQPAIDNIIDADAQVVSSKLKN